MESKYSLLCGHAAFEETKHCLGGDCPNYIWAIHSFDGYAACSCSWFASGRGGVSQFAYYTRLVQTMIRDWAIEKGWRSDIRSIRSVGEDIALMHSELSEALEAWRDRKLASWSSEGGAVPKPEGVLSEMADTVIRILDFCEEYDMDLGSAIEEKMVYNETRAYRHGGKAI